MLKFKLKRQTFQQTDLLQPKNLRFSNRTNLINNRSTKAF